MKFADWLFEQPIDRLGNAFFILTLIWLASCCLLAHFTGKINLWDVVTSPGKDGRERVDGAKLFVAVAFFVMTVTFYYLAVTNKLSEWFVLIYAAAWVGERFRRDLMKLKELSMLGNGAEPKGEK